MYKVKRVQRWLMEDEFNRQPWISAANYMVHRPSVPYTLYNNIWQTANCFLIIDVITEFYAVITATTATTGDSNVVDNGYTLRQHTLKVHRPLLIIIFEWVTRFLRMIAYICTKAGPKSNLRLKMDRHFVYIW